MLGSRLVHLKLLQKWPRITPTVHSKKLSRKFRNEFSMNPSIYLEDIGKYYHQLFRSFLHKFLKGFCSIFARNTSKKSCNIWLFFSNHCAINSSRETCKVFIRNLYKSIISYYRISYSDTYKMFSKMPWKN